MPDLRHPAMCTYRASRNHRHCRVFSGSIPFQRPQTCFLSGSLSVHPGCQRHDQTPLLFPTCGRTDNVFSILEHSWCASEEVGQKAARLSSLAAGGQPASFSFFICENHRNARSRARSQRKGQNNREAEALLRRRTATVILDADGQRSRKGHLIFLLLRQTKDSRKKPCLQRKLLGPGKNQNQDHESSRQPGTSPTAGAPSQVCTVAPDPQDPCAQHTLNQTKVLNPTRLQRTTVTLQDQAGIENEWMDGKVLNLHLARL